MDRLRSKGAKPSTYREVSIEGDMQEANTLIARANNSGHFPWETPSCLTAKLDIDVPTL